MARERRQGKHAWYTSAKKPDLGVAPIDRRVFVVGRAQAVRQLLREREPEIITRESEKRRQAWRSVLQAAAHPRHLTVGLQADEAISRRLQGRLPGAWKALAPALEFQTFLLTVDTGKTSRTAVELTFSEAADAAAAAQTVKELPPMAGAALVPLAQQLSGEPSTRRLAKLLSTLAAGLRSARIAQHGNRVNLSATFAADLGPLLDEGTQEAAVLLVRQGFVPAPPPPLSPAGETAVADALRHADSGAISGDAAAAIAGRLSETKATEAAALRLAEFLKTTDSRLDKIRTCRLLAQIGPGAARAVPALAELLEDSSALMRRETAKALGAIGPKADKYDRAAAAQGLGKMTGAAERAARTKRAQGS